MARNAVLEAAAGLARRGERGDIVGGAVRELLREGGDASELGGAYESMLELDVRAADGELELKQARGQGRKKLGAYYTPEWLVELVLDSALSPLIEGAGEAAILGMRVLDPSCGAGAFLVGTGERLAARLTSLRGGTAAAAKRSRRDVAVRCLYGVDKDPIAVELCRAAVEKRFGSAPGSHVVLGDGLLDELPGGTGYDVVVGNPPFLNRLERLTEVDRGTALAFKEQFGAAARAYTDVSALFLLRAVRATRAGGRIAMVQPRSLLGSRDAAGVRESIAELGLLTELWLADEHVFDASVYVCVPTLVVGATNQRAPVQRYVGRARGRATPATVSAGAWASLAAVDVPDFDVRTGGLLGDAAEVTADFRDEYYGLRGAIVEDGPGDSQSHLPPLISTGLIDLATCRWGVETCRFSGLLWRAPRVDVAMFGNESKMAAWARSRLRPKLLLATQTKVLEVAVDEAGRWLPVTPLISIAPRLKRDLWRLGAALASPVLTAAAAKLGGGTGLSIGAIKLSARQVRGLALPAGDLADAGRLFRDASLGAESNRRDTLIKCARATCVAYGLGPRESGQLLEWWSERLCR